MPATKNEYLQQIVEEYREAGQPWPAMTSEIAAWAFKVGKWKPTREQLMKQAAEDFRTAMREEYIRDPLGRSVRAKHAALVLQNGKQLMLWDDIRTMNVSHMRGSVALKRKQIVGDCRQLQIDVNYFNEVRNPIMPIQVSFDFTNDLLEMDLKKKAAA